MSQKSKLTPPVTPVQTRLSSFFTQQSSSGGGSDARKRSLSNDSILPSSPISKQLKLSQTNEPSSQTELPADNQTCDSGEVLDDKLMKLIQQKKEEAFKKRKVSQFTFGMDFSWKSALREDLSKQYFHELIDFVEKERGRALVYPPPQDVFSWSKHCHIQDVRVVILGQDPYHGPSQAHGLCFSVTRGVAIPPSLLNIYKELKSDIPGFEIPKHGHLVSWAEQGVLLLNACLTVRAREANSHKQRGWEQFTDAIVHWINKNLSSVVFLLWGKPAQEKGSAINADRGFFGCEHFSKTNTYLKENNKNLIDWNSLSKSL